MTPLGGVKIEIEPGKAALIGAIFTFVLRGTALAFGWNIPVYKGRPPRT